MFKEIKNKKLFEVILDQIKDQMVTGELKIGQKIPPEIELSRTLGVSRSSLREALKILTVLGMLESKTGEGTIIKKADPENLKSIMSLVIVSGGLDTSELFETRILLEMHAAELAAYRRSEEDLDELKKHLAGMDDQFVEKQEQIELDHLFHTSMVKASKNNMLVILYELISGLLKEQIREVRSELSNNFKVMQRFQKEHWEIYEAIKNQNGDIAHTIVSMHLKSAQHDLGIQSSAKK